MSRDILRMYYSIIYVKILTAMTGKVKILGPSRDGILARLRIIDTLFFIFLWPHKFQLKLTFMHPTE